MDGVDASLYVFVEMGATGLIDMRASFKSRVSTMAVGILLAAFAGLASAQMDDAASLGTADPGAYQRGMHLFHAGQYEQALPYFVRAKDEARSRVGPGSGEHATALNNLGELYRRMELFDEAEPLFREAIAIDEARLGPDHQSLAKPLNNLALVQRARGDFVEAERNQKRSLHILEDTVGRRHPDVAGSLNNLARLYEATGFPERAQPLLERALMIAQATLGEAHPTTKQIAANLERVNRTLADVAPNDLPMAGAARALAADPLPPPAPLRLPPPVDVPESAVELSALEPLSPADLVSGLESTASLDPALLPALAALPEPVETQPVTAPSTDDPAPASEAPALVSLEAGVNGSDSTIEEAEIAAAGGALRGAVNGAAETVILPRQRPAGLRWPRLPPGAYAMHLASVRNPVNATEEWRRLADLLGLPEIIRQLEPQRIERGEQGIFYRVLGGPFATGEEAAAACAPVRARGEYCGVLADGE